MERSSHFPRGRMKAHNPHAQISAQLIYLPSITWSDNTYPAILLFEECRFTVFVNLMWHHWTNVCFNLFVLKTLFHKEMGFSHSEFYSILSHPGFSVRLFRGGTPENALVTERAQPQGHYGHEVSFPGRQTDSCQHTRQAWLSFVKNRGRGGDLSQSVHLGANCQRDSLRGTPVGPSCQEGFRSDQPREFHVKKHGILWKGWNW